MFWVFVILLTVAGVANFTGAQCFFGMNVKPGLHVLQLCAQHAH